MKFAVLGFGNRGRGAYTPHAVKMEGVTLSAVCEKRPCRLERARKEYSLSDEQLFLSDEEFFAAGKLADLLIIATQDGDHYGHAMRALDVGYDILLEKPMAQSYEQCKAIADKAEKLGRRVYICHVLRYAPFFVYIKNQVEKGVIGKVETIAHTENVAYWHQSHSFVRGNWSVTEETTPMILAKCCHDLDMIYWLIDRPCTAVSSFGSLDFFTRDNAPEGSGDYCCECPLQEKCAFDCVKFYEKNAGWLAGAIDLPFDRNDPASIRAVLSRHENPYSRCVFKCDNTAVDHQVVNMLFEGGVTAQLTMTAFAADCYRELHIHGTRGEIIGDMLSNKVKINIYGGESTEVDIGALTDGIYGHGGGDQRLITDVINTFRGVEAKGVTSIQNSLMSHKIGYAAEASRLAGGELVKL